jgi:hypothetical protein
MNDDEKKGKLQANGLSQEVAERLEAYIARLVTSFSAVLDKRLVKTLVGLIEVIISFREYRHGSRIRNFDGTSTNYPFWQ